MKYRANFADCRWNPAVAARIVIVIVLLASSAAGDQLSIFPKTIQLTGPEASQQLLVTRIRSQSQSVDVTRRATYKFIDPSIAEIDQQGLIRPKREGRTKLVVELEGTTAQVVVEVRGLKNPPPVIFEHEVMPILSKAGCNAAACHGKAEGKNGFKLSVFGYDPIADHAALAKQSRGRRISPAIPDASLLLRKAAAIIPHGGGEKIARASSHYRRLRRWIAEGGRNVADESRQIVAIEVRPSHRVLSLRGSQQIQVTAIDAAGRKVCVTRDADFVTNSPRIAQASKQGLVTTSDVPGEAAILVRYMGQVGVFRVTLPRVGVTFERPPEVNFIDRLAWDKLQSLGIKPSPATDDGSFMRRVYLDTIGTLPTVAEARTFLINRDPKKRAKLIDRLLKRDEYADYWALRWSDLLRVDKDKATFQGAVAMSRWLRRQFATNRPYDEMVHEIITARGNIRAESPAAFYKVLAKPEIVSRSVSQLFLGVRIECAQCHHHPSEKWTQEDYYAMAGFFTGFRFKGLPGGGEAIVVSGGTDLKHPRTGKVIPARALAADAADFTNQPDRRVVLARWMTGRANPFFAKAIANRLWAHYFGRGLVEPIDDMRATNPASNPKLLAALANHLVQSKYDLKALTRTMLNSHLYQLSSEANDSNRTDAQNFSHARGKSLPAEVLLDAFSEVTGVPEKFNGWPSGVRAIQVWDNRMPSYFFRIFGRPVRATVCECERSSAPSVAQALHLMNSPEMEAKISARRGRARQLADSNRSPRQIIDVCYLSAVARFPSDKERQLLLPVFAEPGVNRRTAVEDIMWTLLNSKEFIFNH